MSKLYRQILVLENNDQSSMWKGEDCRIILTFMSHIRETSAIKIFHNLRVSRPSLSQAAKKRKKIAMNSIIPSTYLFWCILDKG